MSVEPIITGERGVDRDYVCVRCGQTARDRWDAQGRHIGGRTEPCAQHPSAPARGPCLFVESSTGRVLGGYHGAAALREVAAWVARTLALAALLAGYAGALLYAPVRAEGPRSLTPLERRVALHHARVSANEAGFDRASDSLAIWQTLENIAGGRDAPIEELDAALNEHCGRMTGARPHRGAERGNHRWSRDLDWSGREPARWAELNPQLPWHFYRERWRLVLARSVRLVRERPHLDVCAGEEPITWGGRRGLDAEVLARRNAERARRGRRPLVELQCSWRGEPTFNGFYGVARGGRS